MSSNQKEDFFKANFVEMLKSSNSFFSLMMFFSWFFFVGVTCSIYDFCSNNQFNHKIIIMSSIDQDEVNQDVSKFKNDQKETKVVKVVGKPFENLINSLWTRWCWKIHTNIEVCKWKI